MADFVPGQVLCAAFHAEVVAPLLDGMPHAAALWGTGSDVLGYDTVQSTDHGWGPHAQVFVAAADVAAARAAIAAGLPATFRGWPVRYGSDRVAVQHHVRVATLAEWLSGHLGVDPRAGMTTLDWLTIPQQMLLEVAGPAFADPDGELRRVQGLLAAFPPQVRLWVLGCQWDRVGEEEAFAGRAAQVGDELGARIVAARLVRELMRVGFLLADAYWPYTKWFGTAFGRLPIAAELSPLFAEALTAHEDALVADVVARNAGRDVTRRPDRPPVPHATLPGARRGSVRRGLPGRGHRSGARGATADRFGGSGGRQHTRSLEHRDSPAAAGALRWAG